MAVEKKEKVLVVDDEKLIRRLIVLSLSRDEYEIIEAGNGEEALEKARVEMPDLIILDIILPGMDGWEVAKRMREEGIKAPLVMLTKKRIEVGDWQSKIPGPIEYATKPFVTKSLGLVVERALDRVKRKEVSEK